MKKVLFAVITTLSLAACQPSESEKSNATVDSLTSLINERDSSVNHFLTSFNEIEANLDAVAEKQKIISTYTDKKGELNKDKKARINAEIIAINDLMTENRKEIEALTKKLRSSKNKNVLLEKTISALNLQLAQKDSELAELNQQLLLLGSQIATLKTVVDSLYRQNHVKSEIINVQTANLHSAYYRVGKKKELKEEKIIQQTGGVLGLGKSVKMNENIDNSKFTAIDYTQTTSIPIDGSNVKIITNHPIDSYTLNEDNTQEDVITNITVTNPEKFWRASKYLVVVKK